VGGDRARFGAPGHFATEAIMMITEQQVYEIAAEIAASFERIQSLLARLAPYSEPEESHRARDLRMSEDDIRRILNRVVHRSMPQNTRRLPRAAEVAFRDLGVGKSVTTSLLHE
jgi:hypothetical protein